jgi:hypothetical protein
MEMRTAASATVATMLVAMMAHHARPDNERS